MNMRRLPICEHHSIPVLNGVATTTQVNVKYNVTSQVLLAMDPFFWRVYSSIRKAMAR